MLIGNLLAFISSGKSEQLFFPITCVSFFCLFALRAQIFLGQNLNFYHSIGQQQGQAFYIEHSTNIIIDTFTVTGNSVAGPCAIHTLRHLAIPSPSLTRRLAGGCSEARLWRCGERGSHLPYPPRLSHSPSPKAMQRPTTTLLTSTSGLAYRKCSLTRARSRRTRAR